MLFSEIKDAYELDNDWIQSDEHYDNYSATKISIQARTNDTKDYLAKMIERRKQVVSIEQDIVLDPKSEKAVNNCYTAINKMSGNCNDDLVKKIKSTIIKYSVYDKFPYRDFADLLESKATFSMNYEVEDIPNLGFTPETIQEIIIQQTIFSLREYTYVHPKVKLIINQLNNLPSGMNQFELG